MELLIIDGQGGQLGGQIIKAILANVKNVNITVVGTNAFATATMLKAGANQAATGENPVIVACRKADATRILLPINKCNNLVAGVSNLNTSNIKDRSLYSIY